MYDSFVSVALEVLKVAAPFVAAFWGAKTAITAKSSSKSHARAMAVGTITGLHVKHAEIRAKQLSPDNLSPTLPMVVGPEGNPDCFYAFFVENGENSRIVPLYTTVDGAKTLNETMKRNLRRTICLARMTEDGATPIDVLVPWRLTKSKTS